MANQEFISFHTGSGKSVHGEHYFRKSAVTYFGIAKHRHGQDDPYFRAKITYATSGSTADTLVLDLEDDTAFKEFIDQMLDTPAASADELAKTRNGLSHMDAPEKPKEEPAFVTRDCLEITEGAEEFFKWLHRKYCNSTKIGCWSFKAVPGTKDEDFIVCHKTNTLTSPADVHISFRGRLTYASVCGIVINDHYTPDYVGFNIILREFVRDILVPYALRNEITYSYSGTPIEQPPKSNGAIENTPETTKEEPGKSGIPDTFVIPSNAGGFYCFLLTRSHYFDNGGKWSVTHRDTLFDCLCTDLDTMETFTVTISFTIDSSYARVTDIQTDDAEISVDQYNHCLCRFVDEMVKPFAEIEQLKYEYSGK